MDGYIARANIDHYLGLLNDPDLPAVTRATITKLLIAEEDRLGHGLEQLEFAEERAARGRDRVNHLRNARDSFAAGSTDRLQADRLLANVEALQHLLDDLCRRLREKVNSRGPQ